MNIMWASGLFVGEGNVGIQNVRKPYGDYKYLRIQISMYDEQAIKMFAEVFGVSYFELFLKHRNHLIYKVNICGRPAEKALALMWPYIKDTDKGDQALSRAKELGVEQWIISETSTKRPSDKFKAA